MGRSMWILKRRAEHVSPETLSEYMDERLQGEERLRVEGHLEACAACMEEMESLQYTVSLLRRMPTVSLRRSFAFEKTPTAAQPTRRPMAPAWAYGAAASLAVALFAAVISADLSGSLAGEAALTPEAVEQAGIADVPASAAMEAPRVVEAPLRTERAGAGPPTSTPAPQIAAMAVEAEAPVDTLSAQGPQREGVEAERKMVEEGTPLPLEAPVHRPDESGQVVTTALQAEATVVATPQSPEEVSGGTALYWHVLEGILGGAAILLAGGILLGARRRHRRGIL